MGVYDKIVNDEYKTLLKYPVKPAKPQLDRNATSIEARAYADALEEYEAEMKSYTKSKNRYHEDSISLVAQFKLDLEHKFGTIGNPKADLLWAKAWSAGHGAGLGDVYAHYSELYELII